MTSSNMSAIPLPIKGAKYESSINPKYVIEFIEVEKVGEILLFKDPSGATIKITQMRLHLSYRLHLDLWRYQRQFAHDHGFVWKDEEPAPTPIFKLEF